MDRDRSEGRERRAEEEAEEPVFPIKKSFPRSCTTHRSRNYYYSCKELRLIYLPDFSQLPNVCPGNKEAEITRGCAPKATDGCSYVQDKYFYWISVCYCSTPLCNTAAPASPPSLIIIVCFTASVTSRLVVL